MSDSKMPDPAGDQARAAAADAQRRVEAGIASGGPVRHDGQTDPRFAAAHDQLRKLFFRQSGLILCDERHFGRGVQPMHWIPSVPGVMHCDTCAEAAVSGHVRQVADRCDLCGRGDLRNPAAGPAPVLVHTTFGQFIVHAVLCAGCAPETAGA